jgi:exonuclease III
MIHVYNIAAWNANGLLQRIKEVEVFLNTQKIDILLVSETHFTEQNYVNILNYITYATNHLDRRAHAGSAIIIRKNIKHHELPKYETDHIQAMNVSSEDWDGNLTISAI